MDDSHIPKRVVGGCYRAKKARGKTEVDGSMVFGQMAARKTEDRK
jgi:hypothetical protein